MKKILPLLVVAVILVSGCISLDGLFGSNAIDVQTSTTQNGQKDVFTINKVETIPTSSVLPSQDVKMYFIIQNQDAMKTARNVFVDLFNPSIFKCRNQAGALATKNDVCTPDGDHKFSLVNKNDLYPGEQSQIVFSLQSPSEPEIGSIKQTATLDYKASYDFAGSLSYVLPVVNMQEILDRQQSNQKTSVQISKSYSSGPIQIDVSLQGAPYLLSDQDAVMIFTVKNVGSGTLANSQIGVARDVYEGPTDTNLIINKIAQVISGISTGNTGDLSGLTLNGSPVLSSGLTIIFPKELGLREWPGGSIDANGVVTQDPKSSFFTCQPSDNQNYYICVNSQPIDVFRDQSRVSMRFRIHPIIPAGTPFRSFPILALTGYTYELRNNIQMTVNPFQNV